MQSRRLFMASAAEIVLLVRQLECRETRQQSVEHFFPENTEDDLHLFIHIHLHVVSFSFIRCIYSVVCLYGIVIRKIYICFLTNIHYLFIYIFILIYRSVEFHYLIHYKSVQHYYSSWWRNYSSWWRNYEGHLRQDLDASLVFVFSISWV